MIILHVYPLITVNDSFNPLIIHYYPLLMMVKHGYPTIIPTFHL